MTTSDLDDARLQELLRRLTLEEKVLVLTGHDIWGTWPIEKIGLRRMAMSDGPSGVRGEVWDERSPSINLPSATALSSSWDTDIAYRYGTVAASEARRKNIDIVLGPTINLHRSPLGGRHFEAFSEDPMLTAELAAAYVRGVQDNGVGATPKHYVANDFETERFTADVVVSDRALRELYLLAFERAVTESRAWLVMSAYNSINGVTASENDLLETPLNSEWGFDGVVVSDWTGVRSLRAAEASQDLVMPGPDGAWGNALVEAVRDGRIDEAVVDRKVLRLLVLATRVGALDGFEPPAAPVAVDGLAFAREAAAEGMVLVQNDGLLPITPGAVTRIAVIGGNAVEARTQGGGSATVFPESVVSPLDGLRAAYPAAEVTYAQGAIVRRGLGAFPLASMTNPANDEPGAHVRMFDEAGAEIWAEDRLASAFVYMGGDAPIRATTRFEFATRWTPDTSGPIRLGCAAIGDTRFFVDGELVGERSTIPTGGQMGIDVMAPQTMAVDIETSAGTALDIRIELDPYKQSPLPGALFATFGTKPGPSDPEAMIAEAVAAAEAADVAIVVVGTNAQVESEGFDRTSLDLPGRQDDLVAAIAAANPRTLVVVNSGSPVALPWRNEVPAVLVGWFGGQEFGNALADVITGAREPGGRLPTTWAAQMSDLPVVDVAPVDGRLPYDEGIHIGYRAWMRSGTDPAYEFGAGLGYTTWSIGDATVVAADADFVVTVPVTNTGDRHGKHVVQVYAARPDSSIERPARWLVGFAVVRAAAGDTVDATIEISRRAFAHWDGAWCYETGRFDLLFGTTVTHIASTVGVHIPG